MAAISCPVCNNNHVPGECPKLKDRIIDGPKALYLTKKPRDLDLDNMTAGQKVLYYIGKVSAAIFALSCGVSTAAAFIGLNILTGGLASVVAVCILLATTIANWYICKKAAPAILISFFGRGTWAEDLLAVDGGCDFIRADENFDVNDCEHLLTSKLVNSLYIAQGNERFYFNRETGKRVDLPVDAFDSMYVNRLEYNKAIKLSGLGLNTIKGHQLISLPQKIGMGLGTVLALSVGLTFAGLAYTSTPLLAGTFAFLAVISPALPPIAGLLAFVTLISLTTLMLKDIIDFMKTENILQACWNFLKNMVVGTKTTVIVLKSAPNEDFIKDLEDIKQDTGYLPVMNKEGQLLQLLYFDKKEEKPIFQLQTNGKDININWRAFHRKELAFWDLEKITPVTGQEAKGRARILFEGICTALLTVGFIPVAIVGLLMTQNACMPGVKAVVFDLIPKASAAVVNTFSYVVCLGLALAGQIPFTISTSVQTTKALAAAFIGIFSINTILDNCNKSVKYRVQKLLGKNEPLSVMEKVQLGGLLFIAVINAVGNGCVAALDATMSFSLRAFAGIAGFWNSASAGITSVTNNFKDKKDEIIRLYEAQEERRFWQGIAIAILTPFSGLMDIPYLNKVKSSSDKYYRIETSTQKYENNAKREIARNQQLEAEQPEKEMLVIYSTDFRKVTAYGTYAPMRRFGFIYAYEQSEEQRQLLDENSENGSNLALN